MSEEEAPNLGEAVSALTEGQKVFDRYTLMKVVGSGRMSVVWLAWDESEEHDCALKFLPDMVKPDLFHDVVDVVQDRINPARAENLADGTGVGHLVFVALDFQVRELRRLRPAGMEHHR